MFVMHSPSGRYRVHALNADGSTRLTITDTRTGRPVTLRGVPDGDLGGVRFNRDETMIAFTVASDTSPADIFVADLATGQARRLTRALNPAIDERQLVDRQRRALPPPMTASRSPASSTARARRARPIRCRRSSSSMAGRAGRAGAAIRR